MKSLEFDPSAFEDLVWWIQNDRNTAMRIARLIRDIHTDRFTGIGKREPLKAELRGFWSRRIDREHRLVYQVTNEEFRIVACRYHYAM